MLFSIRTDVFQFKALRKLEVELNRTALPGPSNSNYQGQKEAEEGLVSVRSRFVGDEGQKKLEAFIADLSFYPLSM